jgi:hypothetical protein
LPPGLTLDLHPQKVAVTHGLQLRVGFAGLLVVIYCGDDAAADQLGPGNLLRRAAEPR